MADMLRGVNAGISTGLLSALSFLIIGVIRYYFGLKLNHPFDWGPIIGDAIILGVVFGIGSLVAGLLFSLLYNMIPTKNSRSKGIIFISFYALIMQLLVIMVTPEWPLFFFTNFIEFIKVMVYILISGFLLGYFWNKFEQKKPGIQKK